MNYEKRAGHLSALVTIVIWGTTFISTKVLLKDFQRVEILFYRFLIGLAALCLISRQRLSKTDRKEELYFAAAGLCRICLYYMLENIALTMTSATNVGVIISAAPFFTAIISSVFLHEAKPRMVFYIGFLLAMSGIVLISVSGFRLEMNMTGDLLALAAAVVWGLYSVLTRKISTFGYPTIPVTRRIFCYGILFMLPALLLFDFKPDFHAVLNPVCLLNLLYLGLGASALCFVTWNYAVRVLGAVSTSV